MTQATLFPERRPTAEFSQCERYRYLLRWPTGIDNDRVCLWVLANPSAATEKELDPTLRRCVDFSYRWGYGWMWVVNVRAWRETDPRMVPSDPLAIGPHNDEWILDAAERAKLVVCGWGTLGGARGNHVASMLQKAGVELHALRLNRDGSPFHPLYAYSGLRPLPMRGAA